MFHFPCDGNYIFRKLTVNTMEETIREKFSLNVELLLRDICKQESSVVISF